RRGERAEARRLLEHASAAVLIEGRVAVLPDSARGGHYFASSVRPAARLLSALLEIEPTSPLIGPLVERIAGASAARDAAGAPLPGAGGVLGHWNTQDLGAAALALARYEEFRREAGSARV